MSHLGSRVSALLDGHLSAAEEERCWNHVHGCHVCRDLVEREGWVKTRLAQLSFGSSSAPDGLKDSLLGQQSALAPAAFATASHAPGHLTPRSRHRGLAAIGGGAAAGACVVGVLALGLAGSPRVEPRPPMTDLTGSTTPASPQSGARDQRRAREVHGPAVVTPMPLTERLLLVREKMVR